MVFTVNSCAFRVSLGLLYASCNEVNLSFAGKVPLKTSRTFKNKFERGQTDVFTIDALVGEVQKIR